MIIVTGDEYTRWLDTLERFLTPHITQGRFKIHNADPLLSRRREFRAD